MTMRVLITGMSGTGKSTVIRELQRRGFRAVDLDSPDFSQLVPAAKGETTGVGGGMDWVWNEERVAALLDSAGAEPLFLSGCSPNQGRFYDRLDRERNEAEGLVSTCELMMPPDPALEGGRCVMR